MPVSTECAAALLSFRYPSLHTEIHKLTELKDKHIFIFFQRKTTRGQATSQFESCTEMASL